MFVVKWYTRASRVRIVIAKFDGRWNLPGGPYPIPELVALVTGVLATLFLMPRLGEPIITLIVGIAGTAGLVATMRRMPYSPVKFTTRVHRVMRLYTEPVTTTGRRDLNPADTATTVRPKVAFFDHPGERADAAPPRATRRHQASPDQAPHDAGWSDMFAHEPTPAAGLFG